MSVAFIGPIRSIVSITTSDTVDMVTGPCRSVYVGVAGNLKITTPSGEDVTLVGLAAGIWHPFMAVRIWATGSTATDIFAGY